MDFNDRLATRLDISPDAARRLTEALVQVVSDAGEQLGAVSIPRFGTFETVKEDEHIELDRASGKRVLLPPSITLRFKPGAMLRKALTK